MKNNTRHFIVFYESKQIYQSKPSNKGSITYSTSNGLIPSEKELGIKASEKEGYIACSKSYVNITGINEFSRDDCENWSQDE